MTDIIETFMRIPRILWNTVTNVGDLVLGNFEKVFGTAYPYTELLVLCFFLLVVYKILLELGFVD